MDQSLAMTLKILPSDPIRWHSSSLLQVPPKASPACFFFHSKQVGQGGEGDVNIVVVAVPKYNIIYMNIYIYVNFAHW